MVDPCKCKGSQRWVHCSCIRLWQRRQRESGVSSHVIKRCGTCGHPYSRLPEKELQLDLPMTFYFLIGVVVSLLTGLYCMMNVDVMLGKHRTTPPIQIPESIRGLRPGQFLVSTEQTSQHEIFNRSVVLLLAFTPGKGATGFIVNKHKKPTADAPAWFSPVGALGTGGPMVIEGSEYNALHNVPITCNGILPVSLIPNGVFLAPAVNCPDTEDAARRMPSAKLVILHGHCAWSAYQLENELLRGVWRVRAYRDYSQFLYFICPSVCPSALRVCIFVCRCLMQLLMKCSSSILVLMPTRPLKLQAKPAQIELSSERLESEQSGLCMTSSGWRSNILAL